MLLQDVSMAQEHVVFAVDRAGFVGADGETHHGLFDISYLSSVPGMAVYAPETGFQRAIHNIENAPFRTKFGDDMDAMHGNMGIGCISGSRVKTPSPQDVVK